jgi:hypothetical protein
MQISNRTNRVLAIIMLLLVPALADGAPLLRLPWEGLYAIVGQTVSIAMPGGALVTGVTTAVESDALVMTVTKTTDPDAYPKGPLRAPRATLHRFDMLKKGCAYRTVLTPVGFFAGLIVGIGVGYNVKGDKAQAAAFLGAWTAGIAGGYLLGNAADRHWTTVEVLP